MLCTDPDVTVTLGEGAGALAIPGRCDSPTGVWWNALELPAWTMRMTYAPPSVYVPGQALRAAVVDAAQVTLNVVLRAEDLQTLETMKADLAARLAAWPSVVTVTAVHDDDPAVTLGQWESMPTVPSWGRVTPQRLGLLVAETPLAIPVNPPGSP